MRKTLLLSVADCMNSHAELALFPLCELFAEQSVLRHVQLYPRPLLAPNRGGYLELTTAAHFKTGAKESGPRLRARGLGKGFLGTS